MNREMLLFCNDINFDGFCTRLMSRDFSNEREIIYSQLYTCLTHAKFDSSYFSIKEEFKYGKVHEFATKKCFKNEKYPFMLMIF